MTFWDKVKICQGAMGVSKIENMVEGSSREDFGPPAGRQGSTGS